MMGYDQGWVVEASVKGGRRIREMRVVVQTNLMHLAREETTEWMVIGWAPTLETAQGLKRNMGKE